jgi:ferredoxin
MSSCKVTMLFILCSILVSRVLGWAFPATKVHQCNPTRLHSHNSNDNDDRFTITVSYEGDSCQLEVPHGQTILSALESSHVGHELGIPDLPFECRRGNCWTCTARVKQGMDSIRVKDKDATSQFMVQEGLVPTCSTIVTDNGLEIELGVQDVAWKTLYQERLMREETQLVARAAMAKTIRKSNERNVYEWKQETERVLQKEWEFEQNVQIE